MSSYIEEQKSLIIEFFALFNLGEKVQSILEGTHPDYVSIISPTSTSQVGHNGYDNYLTYEVKEEPTIKGASSAARIAPRIPT